MSIQPKQTDPTSQLALLRWIIDRVDHAVVVFDADLRLVFANPRYAEILALPPSLTEAGTTFGAIIRHNAHNGAYGPVDDVEALVAQWYALATDGQDRIDHVRRPDGRAFRIERVVLPDGGSFLSYFDITQLVQRGDELARQSEKLETILQFMDQGLSIVDEDLRFILGNQVYQEIYQFPEDLAAPGRDVRDMIRFRLERGDLFDSMGAPNLEAAVKQSVLNLRTLEPDQIRSHVESHPDGRIIEVRRQRLTSGEIISFHTDVTEREQSRKALELSRQYYRSMLDDQSDLVCRFDADLRVEYSNRAHAEIYDETTESIIGKHFLACVPAAWQDRLLRQVESLTPEQPVAAVENEKHLSNGDVRWYAWINRAIFDADGGFAGLQSVGRDITDRRRIEQALKTSQERFRSIVEDQDDLICRFDAEFKLTFMNPAYVRLAGKSVDDLIGTSILTRMAEPVRNSLVNRLHALTPDQPVHRPPRELWNLADNEVRWLEWTIRALFDAGGRFSEYQAIGRDITEAHRQEMSLRESEQRYRAIVEDQSEMISRFDTNFRVTFVNAAYCRTFGISKHELIGRDLTEVLPAPEDHEAYKSALAKLTPDNPVITGEYPAIVAGGAERWHHWTNRAIFDRSGRIASYQSVGLDFTKRHDAQAALKASEARFRTIVEDQTEYIVRYTPDSFIVTFVNQSYCKSSGRTLDDLIGTSVLDLLTKEWKAQVKGSLCSLTPAAPTISTEIEFVSKTGQRTFEQWTHRAIYDDADRLIEYQSIGRDVTQAAEAREALEASEKHFKSIAEAHPVPVLIVQRATLSVLYASPSSVPILGPDIQAIHAHGGPDLFVDEAQRQRFLETIGFSDTVDQMELSIRAADGRVIPAEITARSLQYLGEAALAIGIVDITERLRAEEEIARQRTALAQGEKMSALGSLLASVAHELNNPLSIILGQAQLMEELAQDPKSVRRAERIRRAADRCSRIVKTFLAMARQKPPSRAPLDLSALAASAVELTSYALRTSGIELSVTLADDLPAVDADGDQLTQVIINILINAQQALADQPAPRCVWVESKAANDGVVLLVTDNGPGVPVEIKNRLFEPFFTTKPEGAGTGIGLSVSHSIVKNHGGRLDIEDTPTGAGARFILWLPQSKISRTEAAPQVKDRSSIRKCRLLIVDDEADCAQTVADMLAGETLSVAIAANGKMALEALAHQDVDAIISDIRMPELDGPAFYDVLRGRHAKLQKRIGFITGDTLSTSVARFLNETGCPVVEKPFEVEDIKRLLAELLAE